MEKQKKYKKISADLGIRSCIGEVISISRKGKLL